jgi:hypothetical protein
MSIFPRYPIYIPSKGRISRCLTAKHLINDRVPFYLVVEPQEAIEYAAKFGQDHLLVLPFSNLGSVIPARNWIKDHATAAGHKRHWQLDDNINGFYRRYRGKRLNCDSKIALAVVEDFTDRYENIAVSGLNYDKFVKEGDTVAPFYLNCHVYSCSLILNSIPHYWRGRYNEDTDICLQVLADGWCTILINAFLAKKNATMTIKGGNTSALYQGDGRLKMARSLERLWPGVVETKRRFRRPQHVVKNAWRKFDTPLKLKPGISLTDMAPNEYGMKLVEVKPIQSPTLKALVSDRLEADRQDVGEGTQAS